MKIINKDIKDIKNDDIVNSKFINIHNNKFNITSSSLKANFYLDSFNYFPITEEYFSFKEIFSWGDSTKYKNFYSKEYIKNFDEHKINFKSMSNIFILGSSPFNNYYTNLVTFLPRIFFTKEKNIKLAIHRNSSNNFRDYIRIISQRMNIEIQLVYLDDRYYKFINSEIPEFLNLNSAILILNSLKLQGKIQKGKKIYIQRRDSNFRNIVNELDLIDDLKKKGFVILNLNELDIESQIEQFSTSEIIVAATGSGLANIVFCNKGTKIFEISPKYKHNYEMTFKSRYSTISKYLHLEHTQIQADPININFDKINDKKITNILNNNILENSNYYKNLLLNLNEFNQITQLSQ